MADDRVKGEQKGAGRAMPFSDEAERSVLSSVLIDAAVAQEIIPTMTEEDFQKFSGKNGGKVMTGTGYGKADMETSTKVARTCSFVKDNFSEVTVVEGKGLTRSMLWGTIFWIKDWCRWISPASGCISSRST